MLLIDTAGFTKETCSSSQPEFESFASNFHLGTADPHLHALKLLAEAQYYGSTVVENAGAAGSGGCWSRAHSASM
jgi:hypothetical protein